MLIAFFDCHGIVHQEFVPEGQTVNAAFYEEVSKRLRDCVRRALQTIEMEVEQVHCIQRGVF
jgi:hypothetical protein